VIAGLGCLRIAVLALLVAILALVGSPAGAAIVNFTGAESGDFSEASRLGAATIDGVVRRTGLYAYKAVSASRQARVLFGVSGQGRNSLGTALYCRVYLYVDVRGAPSSSTSTSAGGADGRGMINELLLTYAPNGLVTGQGRYAGTITYGELFSVPTRQWNLVEYKTTNLGSSATVEIKFNGRVQGTATGVNTGASATIDGCAGFGPSNGNGLDATHWFDDAAWSLDGYLGAGKSILRRVTAGPPVHDTFTKTGGTTVSDVWAKVPSTTRGHAASTVASQAQTARVADVGSGADFIRPSDRINAAKVVILAKLAPGTAGTYAVRRRVGDTDTDTVRTLTRNEAYYDSGIFTASLSQLHGMEVGVVRGPGGTANLQVAVVWLMVDYTTNFADVLPALWDTAWLLPLAVRSTIDTYLSGRQSDGFDAVMFSVGDYQGQNTALGNGTTPFTATKPAGGGCSDAVFDVTTPRDAAFTHIDHIVTQLGRLGMTAAILPMTNGTADCYVWTLSDVTAENRAYSYGGYIGRRYKQHANIIWVVGGDTCSPSTHPTGASLTQNFVHGLRDAGALQPVTWHPGTDECDVTSAGSSSSWLGPDGQWLDFNTMQQYHTVAGGMKAAVRAVTRLEKPAGVGEFGYEDGFTNTLHILRNDAYQSYLSRAAFIGWGRQTSGFDSCCTTNFAGSTGSPGAAQMRMARDVVVNRGWLSYSTDESFIIASAGGVVGMIKGNVSAMVYLATSSSKATLDMGRFDSAGTVTVTRLDPATGEMTSLGEFATSGPQGFDTGGLSDALILIGDPVRPTGVDRSTPATLEVRESLDLSMQPRVR
jgi:hypothetical protein